MICRYAMSTDPLNDVRIHNLILASLSSCVHDHHLGYTVSYIKHLKKGNAACFYTPIVLKLNYCSNSMAPQKWKVPISIVTVHRIDHNDWLDIMVDDLSHLPPHVLIFLRYPILLISQCMEMNRWSSLHFIYLPQSPNLDRYYHESAFLHQAYNKTTALIYR